MAWIQHLLLTILITTPMKGHMFTKRICGMAPSIKSSKIFSFQVVMCRLRGNTGAAVIFYYVPYRLLKLYDMSTPNLRKRLSDYRFLMGKLEEKLVEQSRWIANANVSQANKMLI
jgi:hypothetical protein